MKIGLACFFTFFSIFVLQFHVQAQILQLSTTQLNFGPTFETQTDSLSIVLTNTSAGAILISPDFMAPVYGNMPFSCRDTLIALSAFSSVQIWIRFRPLHNILNNAELILKTCSSNNCFTGFYRIDLRGQGRFSMSYYNSTENLSEQALKNAIKTRISSPFTQQSYNSARDFMFMSVDNQSVNGQGAPVNTLTCVYTGRTITGYTSRSQAQNSPFNFNTEHTWPQSLFNEGLPMRSDLFHLFPTDIAANGSRSNFPFGIPTAPFQNVSINSPSVLGANSVYQPRPQQRGATARAMMYFILRYQNYGNFYNTQESILKGWHVQFPPDSIERKRCQDISTVQSNRNPFIDYPQLADRITSFSSANSAAVTQILVQTPGNIHFGEVFRDSVYSIIYPIVNTGNASVSLSNFQLSHPDLSFSSGNTTITLPPGEAHIVGIQYSVPTVGAIIAQATFTFNQSGSTNSMSIPILANASLGEKTEIQSTTIQVFPNPSFGILHIVSSESHIHGYCRIIDIHSKILLEQELENSMESIVNLKNVPAGSYILEVHANNRLRLRKHILLQ